MIHVSFSHSCFICLSLKLAKTETAISSSETFNEVEPLKQDLIESDCIDILHRNIFVSGNIEKNDMLDFL